MLRRLLVFAALAGLAFVFAASALAATVTVRVEGKTRTIFGPTPVKVDATTALQALDAASVLGEFHYALTSASFGDYVSQVGKYAAAGSSGWVFKVNGVSPPVGADKVQLKDGDTVLWYWATFGDAGGPPTLDLQRLPGNCYLVAAVDDNGRRKPAAGATLHFDGRRLAAAQGRACIGKHVDLVRATAPATVRSNAVT